MSLPFDLLANAAAAAPEASEAANILNLLRCSSHEPDEVEDQEDDDAAEGSADEHDVDVDVGDAPRAWDREEDDLLRHIHIKYCASWSELRELLAEGDLAPPLPCAAAATARRSAAKGPAVVTAACAADATSGASRGASLHGVATVAAVPTAVEAQAARPPCAAMRPPCPGGGTELSFSE